MNLLGIQEGLISFSHHLIFYFFIFIFFLHLPGIPCITFSGLFAVAHRNQDLFLGFQWLRFLPLSPDRTAPHPSGPWTPSIPGCIDGLDAQEGRVLQ